MEPIRYIERTTKSEKIEKVYGESAIKLLYGKDFLSRIFGSTLLHRFVKWPFFSHLYGWWQRTRWTKRKIEPFISAYNIDPSEFLSATDDFSSFDAFFSRKLRPETRPIDPNPNSAVIPADGRYLVYQTIKNDDLIEIKGTQYSLSTLLAEEQASSYHGGSLVVARLAPPDYHRFHFPITGKPGPVRLLEGSLYSVNPIALKTGLKVFTENKRMITVIDSPLFGPVTMIEVGATNVGSIHQTYINGREYAKGEEKGYFSFGGSAILLLFQPGKISLSKDLLDLSEQGIETLCHMGQPLGSKKQNKVIDV